MKEPSLSIFILPLPVLATKDLSLLNISFISQFLPKKELLSPANIRRILSTKNRKICNFFTNTLKHGFDLSAK